MKYSKHIAGHPGGAALCLPPPCVALGRLLLALAAVLLVVMPFTEHFCNWDRFLRGGPDLELTLLAVLTFFCMVLVFSQQCSQWLQFLLTLNPLRESASVPPLTVASFNYIRRNGPTHRSGPLPSLLLPLQI